MTADNAAGSPDLRIGLVQMSCADAVSMNLDTAETAVRTAAAQNAQVICLQELFRSPYFCQEENARFFDLAEPVPGPTLEP